MSEREARSQAWAMRVHSGRRGRLFYGVVVRLVRWLLLPYLRVRRAGTERLAMPGPVILAPVHRSNLDSVIIAGVSARRIRALGKESLFAHPVFAWINAALGAIPVRRGEADRQAMRAAQEIITGGEMMIVFPEGTRQSGPTVEGLFDGTAYLAQKTGAPIVPIGIGGTEAAMGSGSRGIRRVRCAVVVGEPIRPPEGRTSRPQLAEFSATVSAELQRVFDEARELAGDEG